MCELSVFVMTSNVFYQLSLISISIQVNRSDGLKTDHFQESVKMSTYLVAFVVCDYVSVNATTKDRNITVSESVLVNI